MTQASSTDAHIVGGLPRRSGAARVRAVAIALRFQYIMFEVGPYALGAAIAWAERGSLRWPTAVALLAATVLIGQASEPFNEYFDWTRGADSYHRETVLSGGMGVIERGLLTPSELMTVSLVTLLLGGTIGTVLSVINPLLLPLGIFGGFLAVAYSAPPFKLRYRGLGELAMGLGKGTIVVWAAYVAQTHGLSDEAVVLGIGYAFVVATFMHVKCFGRYENDRQAHKKTLLYLSGVRLGIWLYGVMWVAAYLAVIVSALVVGSGWWGLLTLVVVPLLVVIVSWLRRDPLMRDQLRFKRLMRVVLVATNGFPVLLAVGVMLNGGS